jgi:hypothetical protein
MHESERVGWWWWEQIGVHKVEILRTDDSLTRGIKLVSPLAISYISTWSENTGICRVLSHLSCVSGVILDTWAMDSHSADTNKVTKEPLARSGVLPGPEANNTVLKKGQVDGVRRCVRSCRSECETESRSRHTTVRKDRRIWT